MRCTEHRRTWLGSVLFVATVVPCQPVALAAQGLQDGTGQEPIEIKIDLDRAVKVTMPRIEKDLKPVVLSTPDGKEGWVLRIPGGRPIATPAYADGMLFVGGGYGSHEFYALDATTGEVRWRIKTKDDGPTAAVVEDGCVAFNTESCTVYVVDARTGKVIWEEWLGDPLMSQPAIADGRLYMAYPSGPRPNQNTQPQSNLQQQAKIQIGRAGHRLLCADLMTGKHLWEQELTADIISAPVIEGDRVYLTCFDGTSFCVNAADGTVAWKKQNSGTSAPVVASGYVVISQKQKDEGAVIEGLKRLDPKGGEEHDDELLAAGEAAYLKPNRGGGVALKKGVQQELDASVGFANAPVAAQLGKANSNVGVNTVVGAWAYQGSRAAFCRGQFLNAQGRFLNCIRSGDGRVAWRAKASGKGIRDGEQIFSPPALGRQQMYLCSAQGHLISVDQDGGQIGFQYATGVPMAFQPALAKGNVYVGTANGLLICLKTGDLDADGWFGWGGNAQHNKKN